MRKMRCYAGLFFCTDLRRDMVRGVQMGSLKLKSILKARGYGASKALSDELGKAESTVWSWVQRGATVDPDGTIRSGSGKQTKLGVMKL